MMRQKQRTIKVFLQMVLTEVPLALERLSKIEFQLPATKCAAKSHSSISELNASLQKFQTSKIDFLLEIL